MSKINFSTEGQGKTLRWDVLPFMVPSSYFPVQDFYASWDLVDSTLRQNMVALAQPHIDLHGPYTSFLQVQELADILIGDFLTWDKFSMASKKSCPSLAAKGAATLQVQDGLECESMLDVPGSLVVGVDATMDDIVVEEEEEEEEEENVGMTEGLEEVVRVVPKKAEENSYCEFVKGLKLRIISRAFLLFSVFLSPHLKVLSSAIDPLSFVDFVEAATMLLVSKQVTRRGDGPANMAMWKLLLPEFFATGHVIAPAIGID